MVCVLICLLTINLFKKTSIIGRQKNMITILLRNTGVWQCMVWYASLILVELYQIWHRFYGLQWVLHLNLNSVICFLNCQGYRLICQVVYGDLTNSFRFNWSNNLIISVRKLKIISTNINAIIIMVLSRISTRPLSHTFISIN